MAYDPRSAYELNEELGIQLHLLKKSVYEFDRGDHHEFRNIARALRVMLVPDDRGNPALINLAMKNLPKFLDSRSVPHAKSIVPYFSLASMVLGPQTVGCRAPLDDAEGKNLVHLNDWQEQPIIDDKEGCIYNRLRLIKNVANLAGGTHYPPDVRDYFTKIQQLGITAVHKGQNIEQKYNDVEKHSLRQIAHELIRSLDPNYRREGQFEGGSLMIGSIEMILYPGRKILSLTAIKTKPFSAIQIARPSHGFDGIGGPVARLPYEDALPKQPCPCGSTLPFRNCCSEEREIDPDIIDQFECRFKLGKYREGNTPQS